MKKTKAISEARAKPTRKAKPKQAIATAVHAPKKPSAQAPPPPSPRLPKTMAKTVPTPVPATSGPAAGTGQILAELKALRAFLQPSDRSLPTSADHVLESGVHSIRRLLSELLEKQTHGILARLVALLDTATEAPRVAREIEALLDELGAVRFRAESLDYVDPLVHTVVEERPQSDMTEGLIVATIRPGYRTGVGTVLAKACVAVSRRN
jgi:hypothetical protein